MYRIIGADGREYGPVSAEQLREWISQGRANAETKTLVEGAADWKPLAAFPEFSLLFAAQRPLAPASALGAPGRKTNPLATAGLIMGILSLIMMICCCCSYGFPFNALGLVFSIIALAQIRNNPVAYEGQGAAVAGLVLSLLSLILALIVFVRRYCTKWSRPQRTSPPWS